MKWNHLDLGYAEYCWWSRLAAGLNPLYFDEDYNLAKFFEKADDCYMRSLGCLDACL